MLCKPFNESPLRQPCETIRESASGSEYLSQSLDFELFALRSMFLAKEVKR